MYYDPVGMGRYNITVFRIQGEALSTAEIERFFRQSHLALHADAELPLADELKRRADKEMRESLE